MSRLTRTQGSTMRRLHVASNTLTMRTPWNFCKIMSESCQRGSAGSWFVSEWRLRSVARRSWRRKHECGSLLLRSGQVTTEVPSLPLSRLLTPPHTLWTSARYDAAVSTVSRPQTRARPCRVANAVSPLPPERSCCAWPRTCCLTKRRKRLSCLLQSWTMRRELVSSRLSLTLTRMRGSCPLASSLSS